MINNVISIKQQIRERASYAAKENAEIREQLRKLEEEYRCIIEDLRLEISDLEEMLAVRCQILDELAPELEKVKDLEKSLEQLLKTEKRVNKRKAIQQKLHEIQKFSAEKTNLFKEILQDVNSINIVLYKNKSDLEYYEEEFAAVSADLEMWERVCENSEEWYKNIAETFQNVA